MEKKSLTARLRQRITLQYPSGTVKKDGLDETVYANGSEVWAEAMPLQGREFFAAQKINSEITMRFSIRYRDGIEPSWRVVYKGKYYEIISVINVEERNRELQLLCKAVD